MAHLDAHLKLFTDANAKEFLKFLKGRYALVHRSNVFFRDIHYGVMSYLELNNVKYGYTNAEELTNKAIDLYEKSGAFQKLDGKTWLLNVPEFRLPVVKPVPAAKLIPGAARPAAAAAPKPAVPVALTSAATSAQKSAVAASALATAVGTSTPPASNPLPTQDGGGTA